MESIDTYQYFIVSIFPITRAKLTQAGLAHLAWDHALLYSLALKLHTLTKAKQRSTKDSELPVDDRNKKNSLIEKDIGTLLHITPHNSKL